MQQPDPGPASEPPAANGPAGSAVPAAEAGPRAASDPGANPADPAPASEPIRDTPGLRVRNTVIRVMGWAGPPAIALLLLVTLGDWARQEAARSAAEAIARTASSAGPDAALTGSRPRRLSPLGIDPDWPIADSKGTLTALARLAEDPCDSPLVVTHRLLGWFVQAPNSGPVPLYDAFPDSFVEVARAAKNLGGGKEIRVSRIYEAAGACQDGPPAIP